MTRRTTGQLRRHRLGPGATNGGSGGVLNGAILASVRARAMPPRWAPLPAAVTCRHRAATLWHPGWVTSDPSPGDHRWWAPAPDPDLPPISPARAYAEVLFVYVAMFGAAIVDAAVIVGGRTQYLKPTGSWAKYSAAIVDDISTIGIAIALVVLLSARRGVSASALGLRVPRRAGGQVAVGLSVRVIAWCFLAIIIGDVFAAVLPGNSGEKFTLNTPTLLFGAVHGITSGIVEELVVVAFVVVTLRQARRPWWELTIVAVVLRGAYHIYYGTAVLGLLVWALLMYWIYLRFRQIVPMMIAHATYDVVVIIAQRYNWVILLGFLLVIVVAIAAVISWVDERGERGGQVNWATAGPGLSPPGWHPDPAGGNRWRWWDGHSWTDHVSQH
jgi:hypothetical protein